MRLAYPARPRVSHKGVPLRVRCRLAWCDAVEMLIWARGNMQIRGYSLCYVYAIE